MNDLEVAQQKALLVLFFECQIRPSQFFKAGETLRDYHVNIPAHLVSPAFEPWFRRGWAKKYMDRGKLCAKLRQDAFGEAYNIALSFLGATTLTVYADLREVVSDADATDKTPMREGWKWITVGSDPSTDTTSSVEREGSSKQQARPINWTKWGVVLSGVGIIVTILLAVIF